MPEAARRLVPPLTAVAVVVIVIVLLLVLNGKHVSGLGPAVAPPSRPSLPAGVVPTVGTSRHPSPTPVASQAPTPTPTAHTAPAAPPPATTRPAVAKVPVTVLNNSRRTGLAAAAAAQLHAHGWPIAQVGNYRGRLPQSTLFYLPGQVRAARLLARQFSGVARVEPRPATLPGHGMTLVVTRYWTG